MKKDYQFFVYILANDRKTTLYIGFTNDLVRRIIEHKNGFGSDFTRKYQLKNLVYYECYQYVHDAITREKELKKWRRNKKIALISQENSAMNDLSQELFDEHGLTKEDIEQITKELRGFYDK
jgi:putative endonuclease